MNIIPLGTQPDINNIPQNMLAMTVRAERYGEPKQAFKMEEVPVPEIAADEVLIAVMAAGLNYNSVWAARAYPIDMLELMHLRGDSDLPYHILGSDASGIVCKVGEKVKNVVPGDAVVVQGGWYNENDEDVRNGIDPTISKSFRAWGYETNFGGYAQFCKVKYFQCLPKPEHLNWDDAATYMVSGVTAYRMLHHYTPHTLKEDDVVLIWGGSGGLGSMAIQLTKAAGAIPIAVVNSADKAAYCQQLGALTINRSDFDHWGALQSTDVLPESQEIWRNKAKQFNKKLLQLTNGKAPNIVIEHPGEDTWPTSLYVCARDGMVVTCAGTSGYLGSFDLRYLWLQNKRIQGSHYANPQECINFNNLVQQKVISPLRGATYSFEELPDALQLMHMNKLNPGSVAIRIGY